MRTYRVFALTLLTVTYMSGGPITFTFSGSDSGSLAGVAFATTAFTITAIGDTSDLVANPPLCGCSSSLVDMAASISISGVGAFDFITPSQVWISNTGDDGGFGRYSGMPTAPVGTNLVTIGSILSFNGWNENSSLGPVTSTVQTVSQWSSPPVVTTGGTLVLNNDSTSPITFQATTSTSQTGEPSSLALMMMAAAAIGIGKALKSARGW
jgi:hypothetical protein